MSENIKPDAIASDYNTLVPSLADNADIQEALRMYHYGTVDGTIPDDSANPIQTESIAGYLGSLQDQIDGFTIGSAYSNTAPDLSVSDNGYIWVDADSAALIFNDGIPTISFYQSPEPTTGLVSGMLWVKSDTNELSIYNGTSWDVVSSSGGGSFSLPTTDTLELFGTSQDVTAAAGQAFYFLAGGTTPTPFSSNTLVTTYSKTEVSVNIGYQSSSGAVGPMTLVRVVNGDLFSPTTIGAFNHVSSQPLTFTFIDEHSEAPGSVLTYGLFNGTSIGIPGDITFSSSYTLQISSKEVA